MPKTNTFNHLLLTLLALLLTGSLQAQDTDADNDYQARLDQALKEAADGHGYRAIVMANNVHTDMEENHYPGSYKVYIVLGTLFESYGNFHMAEHYYRQALENEELNDVIELMNVQSRLACLLKLWKPEEALQWNEMYAQTGIGFPEYHQRYLFVKAAANFAINDLDASKEACIAYQEKEYDNGYGHVAIQAMQMAIDGQYEKAIELLKQPSSGLDMLACADLRTLILRMEDDHHKAARELYLRAFLVDSLNSKLYFDNMNEISTKADITKTRQAAHQEREHLLYIIMSLAIILLILLIFGYLRFRSARKYLKHKNEQLAAALSMAEESDRMKKEFVRNVSHEIRTPLNAINGFNDILNNTDIPLSNEERSDLMKRINENMEAITTIVNELLAMADEKSGQYYTRNDTIFCNQYFSSLLHKFSSQINSHTELSYTTKVINRFKIVTNQSALEEIVEHLIQNAIKFTAKGSITLSCSEAGKYLLVSVTDTGSGISPEMQDKVFEQFAKADMFQQGIGLGLTVSKKIAQRLGGDLILDKQYTGGARFILSLPVDS